jgi:myosin heavy subunit
LTTRYPPSQTTNVDAQQLTTPLTLIMHRHRASMHTRTASNLVGRPMSEAAGSWNSQHEGMPVWVSDPTDAWVEATILAVDQKGDTINVELKASRKAFLIRASTAAYNSKGGEFNLSSEGVSIHAARPVTGSRSLALLRSRQTGLQRIEERQILPRSTNIKQAYEDMDDLPDLNEASILENTRRRFHMDQIYTRTGPILIAMNPFKWLQIYGDDMIQRYHRCEQIDAISPHCFAIGERSYRTLRETRANQSLIICGESGAGKTETTKLILKYLSAIASSGDLEVSAKIMRSNPLMEAFGNAKTLRNNNSSRFGKFISVTFGGADATVTGATVTNYLLEKSRCVTLPGRERNFHIFYQLCAGASRAQKAEYGLTMARDFHYLNQSSCLEVDGMDDAAEFQTTCEALRTLNFSESEQNYLISIVAGILHLGNTEFEDDAEDCANVSPACRNGIANAARLLGIKGGPTALAKALTTKIIHPPRSTPITKELDALEAASSRDALAKSIYSRVFDWLIVHINMSLNHSDEKDAAQSMGGHQNMFIGILDIYGFESLSVNGFEQLFINYANEKLQNLFNALIFLMEQEKYREEGIEWNPTDFPDNQVCLNLIEKKPKGILTMIDEECLLGQGSDHALVHKLHKVHGARGRSPHPNYSACGPATKWRDPFTGAMTSTDQFVVRHYAGNIIYTCEQFLDKNRDTLHDHIKALAQRSENVLVRHVYSDKTGERIGSRGGGGAESANGTGRRKRKNTMLQSTVAARFKTQLLNLMSTLHSTESRFVRCIKTNTFLKPQIFNANEVLRQLKYAGVMAALEMRRSGFPTRMDFLSFATRYHTLLKPSGLRTIRDKSIKRSDPPTGELRAAVKQVLTCQFAIKYINDDMFRLGRTLLFLRANVLLLLDGIQSHVQEASIVCVQSWVRTLYAERAYRDAKANIIRIQAVCRGFVARARRRAAIARMRRNKVMRNAKVMLQRMREGQATVLESAKLHGLTGGSSRNVAHSPGGTTSLDKTLAVLKDSIARGENAYNDAKKEPDRRGSDMHRGRVDKAMLYYNKSEQYLKTASDALDKATRIVDTAVERNRILDAARKESRVVLDEVVRQYDSIKASADMLTKKQSLPQRLTSEITRVQTSIASAQFVLKCDDKSEFKPAVTRVKRDVMGLEDLVANETERLGSLAKARSQAARELSESESTYRSQIRVIDSRDLWDVPAVQRLVDEYEEYKAKAEKIISESENDADFSRLTDTVRSIVAQLATAVAGETQRLDAEAVLRAKVDREFVKNNARLRDIEAAAGRIDFGAGVDQASEKVTVEKALRNVAGAVAAAEEYQIQGSDVAAYEAAVNALASELTSASSVVDREQHRMDKLNGARQRYKSQLIPVMQRWRAIRAMAEVADLLNLDQEVADVFKSAAVAIEEAERVLSGSDLNGMNAAVTATEKYVGSAEREVKRVKKMRADEEVERLRCRELIVPAGKKLAGMHAMAEAVGIKISTPAVNHSLDDATRALERVQAMLDAAKQSNAEALSLATSKCLERIAHAGSILEKEKDRVERVSHEKRRLWKSIDPVMENLDRIHQDAHAMVGVASVPRVITALARADKAVEYVKTILGSDTVGDSYDILAVGDASVAEAVQLVASAGDCVQEERRRKTEEDDERHSASQQLQPAIERMARVQGMVEVAGIDEDEAVDSSFSTAKRSVDRAIEAIHSGDLASAKAAVMIAITNVGEFEEIARREKGRSERDQENRVACRRTLTQLGQRIIAVETLSHMLDMDDAPELNDIIRTAQERCRNAKKSVERIGTNNYAILVQQASISVDAAELGAQREEKRKAESARLKQKCQEEERKKLEREAEHERQRQEDAASLRREAQNELDPAIAKFVKIQAAVDVSGLNVFTVVFDAMDKASEAITYAGDRLVDDGDVLMAHAAVKAAVTKVDAAEVVSQRVSRQRAANDTLRREKGVEQHKLSTETRRLDECEAFVVAHNLSENAQVEAVMEAARLSVDNANDLCAEDMCQGEEYSVLEANPVPLAAVQAAVATAMSRIDSAINTTKREFQVRANQRELRSRLAREKQLMDAASINFRLLEAQLDAIKAEAKVGVIDGVYAEPSNVEQMIFAAEAARTCAAHRMANSDDPEAVHAAVICAVNKVRDAKAGLKLQRTKLRVLNKRSRKEKSSFNEHYVETKDAILEYICHREHNKQLSLEEAASFKLREKVMGTAETLSKARSRTKDRVAEEARQATLKRLNHRQKNRVGQSDRRSRHKPPQRRNLDISMFLKPPATSSALNNAVCTAHESQDQVKRGGAPLMTPAKSSPPPSRDSKQQSVATVATVGGTEDQHSYYVRKRRELGLGSTRKMSPKRSVLHTTPALQELISSSRGPRKRGVRADPFSRPLPVPTPRAKGQGTQINLTPTITSAATCAPPAPASGQTKTTAAKEGEKRGELIPPPDNDEWRTRDMIEGKNEETTTVPSESPDDAPNAECAPQTEARSVRHNSSHIKGSADEAPPQNVAIAAGVRLHSSARQQQPTRGFVQIPSMGSPVNIEPTFHHMHPTDGEAISIDEIQEMLNKNKMTRQPQQPQQSPQEQKDRPEFRVTG